VKHYGTFDPLDPLPAHFPNALQEFLSSLGLGGVQLRVKPGAANTLQVPAGAGDGQVGLTIGGRWRYATSNVEIAGAGTARTVDVYATAHNNSYSSGTITVSGTTYPVENDGTDYSFALAIVDAGAAAPGGVDASRLIGQALWDGAKFTDVAPVVAGMLIVPGQTGDIKATGRTAAPLGWLLCDGSAISRSTYAALFSAISTAYGAGNGSTTFNLPDLRGRVPVGVDGAANRLSANDGLGQAAGEELHTLTSAESGMVAHSHGGVTGGQNADHAHGAGSLGSGWAIAATGGFGAALPPAPNNAGTLTFQNESGLLGGFTGGTTSDHAHAIGQQAAANAANGHNNMPPYQIVSWVIRA
jgi:microcystin-dependent protein